MKEREFLLLGSGEWEIASRYDTRYILLSRSLIKQCKEERDGATRVCGISSVRCSYHSERLEMDIYRSFAGGLEGRIELRATSRDKHFMTQTCQQTAKV